VKYINILIIVIVCIFILFFFNKKEDYVEEYNAKIEKLDEKVDSLQDVNDDLSLKIDTLNIQISELDQELDLKEETVLVPVFPINSYASSDKVLIICSLMYSFNADFFMMV